MKGPEWKYVVIVEEKEKGNPRVQCCFCDKVYVGGSARIREHLHGEQNALIKPCNKVPEKVVDEMRKLVEEKKEVKLKKRKLEALDKATSSKVSNPQPTLPSLIKNKKAVDESVARAFYSAGIPFAVTSNSHFKQALIDVSKFGPGYTPPSEYTMRTSLLKNEVKKVEHEVKSTILNELDQTGGTIVSDGWSNVRCKPLINFILVCTKGDVFLDSTDTSGEDKTSQYIADAIIKQIDAVGPLKVIQVLTDSASNCKSSWPIIEAKFPHITCGPCTAHCLDLLLEDLRKIDWIKDSFREGRDMVTFITTHHKSLAIFRSHSSLELLKPNDTRFCTEFISHSRLIQVKESLQEAVVDKNFKSWIVKQKYKAKGLEISAKVLDDEWWKRASTTVQLCEPMVSLLRFVDGGGALPTIGKVYFRMYEVVQHVGTMDAVCDEDRQAVKKFVHDRWGMLHTDMHSAGFMLDPEYSFEAYSQNTNDEVMSGFCNILQKFHPDDVEKQSLILQQLTQFRSSSGIFAREMVKTVAKGMPGHTWWSTFGGGVPELQSVAVKVLSQVRKTVSIGLLIICYLYFVHHSWMKSLNFIPIFITLILILQYEVFMHHYKTLNSLMCLCAVK